MIKKILTICITILGLFFLTTTVFAQTDQEIAQQYGISFPIAELGNCASIDECKTFCDNPDNYQKCTDFAQEHKLVSTDSTSTTSKSDDEILELAKVELGCSTMDECMAFCNKEENIDKCIDFAAKYSLGGGNADGMKQVISSLKQQFGCSSMTSCMDACNQPDNQQKCMEIFKQAGFDTGSYSNEPPEVWCPKISSECRWDGTNCVCNGPQTCSKSNDIPGCTWDGTQCNCPGIEGSPQDWCPKAGPGCAWDGKQCTCPGSDSSTESAPPTTEPGEVWCPRLGPYCVWDGSSCTCWDDCVKAGGTWTGTRCDLPQESGTVTPIEGGITQPTPEPGEVWCPRNPGCKWTGETCLCEPVLVPQTPESSPAVQGVSTNQGLLQQLIDFLLNK